MTRLGFAADCLFSGVGCLGAGCSAFTISVIILPQIALGVRSLTNEEAQSWWLRRAGREEGDLKIEISPPLRCSKFWIRLSLGSVPRPLARLVDVTLWHSR